MRVPRTLIEQISPGSLVSEKVCIDKDNLAYHIASPMLHMRAILSLRACLEGYLAAVMVWGLEEVDKVILARRDVAPSTILFLQGIRSAT
jgi:hypothetical protein